ncbi:MAG: NADPH-dependent 7-cyano-7-deazaguanine reductase QueF [Prevotellaceae bacterium]|jgi:7-cyano-7-deazaguanine reductase|nr:NADPH-dependent 7-cyano-7-deazaguanine reductase QueF [Prevotellaceae bacterium]
MFDLRNSSLGKRTILAQKRDTSLLFRISRAENRRKIGIDDDDLSFEGSDVWNCYEVSFLTDNGLPVQRILKIVVPAQSKFIVESKSLKLYLFSYNFERQGTTVADAEQKTETMIKCDLENLLETPIRLKLFDCMAKPFPAFENPFYKNLLDFINLDEVNIRQFTHFKEAPELLHGEKTNETCEIAFRTDLLRSNCPVTNQPDWGELFVRIRTDFAIDFAAIAEYVVSLRCENHFHEEVTELIFQRLYDVFCPEKLMVAAAYTRRGGIDINPIRATHRDWAEQIFLSENNLIEKTWRQ